jgi:2-polyprenyl-3-methyl-5-hydroxy-6-metoxy-1,4-benzoquinol methylase
LSTSELTVIQQAVLDFLPELHLPDGGRVLDAPCGSTAALTLELKRAEFSVTGADVDTDAARALGESFVEVDLNTTLPWTAETFDAVISTEGIEHLENAFLFLREVARVLKPGGTLVLTTPNITALRSRVRFLGSGFFGRDAMPLNESARHPLHHIGLMTFPELRYALQVSGLDFAEVRHTHIKPISFLYAFYAPWMWFYTRIAFRKEKDGLQRKRNIRIAADLLSPSLLFGEGLLIVARKRANP